MGKINVWRRRPIALIVSPRNGISNYQIFVLVIDCNQHHRHEHSQMIERNTRFI